jgi:hypothetical protein
MSRRVGVGGARERDHPPSRGFGVTGGADRQIDVKEQARQQDIEFFLCPKCYQRRFAAHLERQKFISYSVDESVYYDIVVS